MTSDRGTVRRALGQIGQSAALRSPAEGGAPLLKGLFSLFVRAEGDRIRAGINNRAFLDVKNGRFEHGRLGLYAERARVIFHRLDVTSQRP